MSGSKAFFDANVLPYRMSEDEIKADRAEQCLAQGGVISEQVLNEIISVTSRKLKLSYADIRDFLTTIRTMIPVEPMGLPTHDAALTLAERYGF